MQDLRKTLISTYSPRELENAKAYSLTTFTEKIREKMVSFAFHRRQNSIGQEYATPN